MKNNPARNVHLKKGPSRLLEKINSSIDIDSRLYNEDIIGSVAHAKMLIKTKIITSSDGKKIIAGLNQILKKIFSTNFLKHTKNCVPQFFNLQ